ncbi:MAG: DNA polymerase I [Defluviitaleaceae bacterium]|nr:DNA polymerase I [Defluviitaleaceae bacterium]
MKILLFDGFSILNRAFYALPPLTNSAGEYTNAIYGFLNIFFRFVDEELPEHVIVAFDLPQPTFRHEMYGAYKGTRKGMPDELRAQVPALKTLLEKMGVTMSACEGYEADDVIGTLATNAASQGMTPVIITGDRDMLQLASDKIKIRLPRTKAGKTEVEDYDENAVIKKYGVSPAAFVDVKALMGDTSDNIPGVPGIGEVTATKIITAYGSLENAIANAEEIKPKKASENLIQFREQAILSRKLAEIALNAPVELILAENDFFNAQAFAEIKRLELKSLYKRFAANLGNADSTENANEPPLVFDTIKTREQAEKFVENLAAAAFFTLWSGGENEWLSGIAVSNENGTKYIQAEKELTLDSSSIFEHDIAAFIKPWLESDKPKYAYDIKSEIRRLAKYGITPRNVNFDTMLGAYAIDTLENQGKGNKKPTSEYAAEMANSIFRTVPIMQKKLAENKQEQLFYDIELPLAFLLAEMEADGIGVDTGVLHTLGEEMQERINALTALIYETAGEEFNINSPAQLGEILFNRLGLKGGKKTTKGFSTAADVLEKLVDQHPIIPLILDYRTNTKLKSTYIEGLLPLVKSSRIHSTFHQALTATGRLSSAEPNLQNIPVRTALGRELRKAFVPAAGCVFIDADYSQIELRLLAHMSGDQVLIDAFNNNQDIHLLTASQVLGIAPEQVTPEQRSNAKAVNFGIVYGISAFGLSEDLKIPVKQAERYINGYFAKYPRVKEYLSQTVAQAKKDGYVATLYNRRRTLSELKSSNFSLRSFGERVAMNMPIQGTAADIIKIAMLNVAKRLKKENLQTKIVLQIHDELLLEAPINEQDKASKILKEEMETAASLSVPLNVDVSVGESWYAAK